MILTLGLISFLAVVFSNDDKVFSECKNLWGAVVANVVAFTFYAGYLWFRLRLEYGLDFTEESKVTFHHLTEMFILIATVALCITQFEGTVKADRNSDCIDALSNNTFVEKSPVLIYTGYTFACLDVIVVVAISIACFYAKSS